MFLPPFADPTLPMSSRVAGARGGWGRGLLSEGGSGKGAMLGAAARPQSTPLESQAGWPLAAA